MYMNKKLVLQQQYRMCQLENEMIHVNNLLKESTDRENEWKLRLKNVEFESRSNMNPENLLNVADPNEKLVQQQKKNEELEKELNHVKNLLKESTDRESETELRIKDVEFESRSYSETIADLEKKLAENDKRLREEQTVKRVILGDKARQLETILYLREKLAEKSKELYEEQLLRRGMADKDGQMEECQREGEDDEDNVDDLPPPKKEEPSSPPKLVQHQDKIDQLENELNNVKNLLKESTDRENELRLRIIDFEAESRSFSETVADLEKKLAEKDKMLRDEQTVRKVILEDKARQLETILDLREKLAEKSKELHEEQLLGRRVVDMDGQMEEWQREGEDDKANVDDLPPPNNEPSSSTKLAQQHDRIGQLENELVHVKNLLKESTDRESKTELRIKHVEYQSRSFSETIADLEKNLAEKDKRLRDEQTLRRVILEDKDRLLETIIDLEKNFAEKDKRLRDEETIKKVILQDKARQLETILDLREKLAEKSKELYEEQLLRGVIADMDGQMEECQREGEDDEDNVDDLPPPNEEDPSSPILKKRKLNDEGNSDNAVEKIDSSHKTAIKIVEASERGEYIKLENGSDEGIDISGWRLKSTCDGEQMMFEFNSKSFFNAKSIITVYSVDSALKIMTHKQWLKRDFWSMIYIREKNSFVFRMETKWPKGKQPMVTLTNAKDEIVATLAPFIDLTLKEDNVDLEERSDTNYPHNGKEKQGTEGVLSRHN